MASVAPTAPQSRFLISSETSLVRSQNPHYQLCPPSIFEAGLISMITLQATQARRPQSEDLAPLSLVPHPPPLLAENLWPGGPSKRCQIYHSHSE